MIKKKTEERSNTCNNSNRKALPEAGQLLETVLKNTSMMAVYLDPDFNFIWVNPAYAATCKRDTDFFPGKNHFALYPHAENQAIFQRVVTTGEPYFVAAKPFEFPDQPERGVTYWDWSLIPEKNKGGKVNGLVFTLTEVTERVRAENALRESEEKFRAIANYTTNWESWFGPDGKYIWVNPAAEHITGYSPEEILAMTDFISILVADEDRALFMERFKDALGGNCCDSFEFRYLHKDGSKLWAILSWQPIFDTKGKSIGVRASCRNITGRKNAEKALLRAKEEWERTFDAVPALITLMDTEHRVIRVNRAMAERLGTTPDKMIGLYCYEAIHGLSEPPDFCPHSKTITTGKEEYAEVAEDHLGGIFDVITVPILGDAGKLVSTIHIAHDITARKKAEAEREKLEAQLSQSQKMESIGRLAGGVAHDYNNMLAVINGYSEILLQKITPADPLYECIQEIRKAGQRSADLTRQLLGFARKQAVAPKVMNINDNIENTLKMLRRLLGEGVELEWKPSPTIWHVKIDPSQLDQILTNLLVNARDAISGVGKVVIETDKADLDESYRHIIPDFVPGKYVVLSVSDNGTGMDKETRDHMFEPFFTTKEAGKGSGLGLATVFGIVKQNQGLINVYSEPGMGTTFKIYLPWYEAENSSAGKSEPEEILKGNETVLLVEDEESLLRFAKLQLERLGYTVLTAGTPKQAIGLTGRHKGKIDLLMTDVVLPEMSGRDLRDKIYSLRPGIKCLFMSGYTVESMIQNGVLEKGIHFLQKPFSAENLSAKLRELLGN